MIIGLLVAVLLAFLCKWLKEKADSALRPNLKITLYAIIGALGGIVVSLLLSPPGALLLGGKDCRGLTCLSHQQAYVIFLLGGSMFLTTAGSLLGIAYGKSLVRKEEMEKPEPKFELPETKRGKRP